MEQAADQVRAMLDEARRDAQTDRRRDHQEGPGRGRGLPPAGRARHRQARDQALAEIWTKTADLAVTVAGKVLDRELGDDDHRRLVEVAIDRAARRPNGQRGPRMSTGPQTRDNAPRSRPATRSSTRPPPSWPAPTPRPCSTPPSKEGQADAVVDELEELHRRRLAGPARFADLLTSPASGHEEKDRLLDRDLRGPGPAVVVRFLRVLNRHGRLDLLRPIVRQARERRGPPPEPPSGRRSARPCRSTRASRRPSRAARPDARRREPVVRFEVDPSLIGGLVVQVGDDVYDASVRSQLERLRREIVQVRIREVRKRLAATSVAE